MAEVDGKIVFKSPEGRMYRVPSEEVEKVTRDLGWTPASDEEAQQRQAEREQYAQFGSTEQQALGALEQTVRTASFGLVPGAPGWEGREQVLEEESPVLSMGAQVAGSLVPGLGAARVVGGAAKLAGAGARLAQGATVAAEGLASGAADEVEQARFETRDVSVGNVFLYGLGTEIVGRALPAALKMGAGKIRRAATPAEAAAGEGLENALAAAEARSAKSQSKLVADLPDGPERLQALQRPEVQAELYDTMATEGAKALDDNGALMSKLGDTSGSALVEKRLRETIPDKSPAQTEWVTGLTRRLDEFGSAIRAPLRETQAKSVDEYLDSVKGAKAKKAAAKEIQDEVTELARQKGLDTRDVIDRRELELQALSTRPIASKQTMANTPGIPGIAQKIESTIRDTVKRLDGTDDNVEWFLAARRAKQDLQGLSAKMGKAQTVQDQAIFDQLRGMVDDTHRYINRGTTDKSLFGAAAEIERDINAAWHDKWFRGIGVAEGDLARKVDWDMKTGRIVNENDPAKIRSFLKGDAIERQVTQKRLEMVLEGFEEMAQAHTKHGTALPAEIEALRANAARVREFLSVADEIQVAKKAAPGKVAAAPKTLREQVVDKVKGYATDRAAGAAGAAVGGAIGGPVGMAAGWAAGEVARAGLKRALGKGAKEGAEGAAKASGRPMLSGAAEALETGAGRFATGPAGLAAGLGTVAALRGEPDPVQRDPGELLGIANRLVGIDAAARSRSRSTARGLAGVGQASTAARSDPVTPLSRFAGDYNDPRASFEAKRQALEQEQIDPTILYEVIAETLGDIPKVNPELFQKVAARAAEGVRYLRANMPAGIKTSLLYPNGTPPSESALREWATMWNTFTDPETVYEDIDRGTATRLQMVTLQNTHPDLYEDLRADVIEQVGVNFANVPISTKLQLDMLFQADGLAGPMFSSAAADMVGQALKDQQSKGQAGAQPDSPSEGMASSGPGGLNAIQSSVTNRGGGA
jgi:hypothetical protein